MGTWPTKKDVRWGVFGTRSIQTNSTVVRTVVCLGKWVLVNQSMAIAWQYALLYVLYVLRRSIQTQNFAKICQARLQPPAAYSRPEPFWCFRKALRRQFV